MRIPFLQRESESDKQARIAAEDARRAAKARSWKQFWFKIRISVLGTVLAFLSLIAASAYFFGPPTCFDSSSRTRVSAHGDAVHSTQPSNSADAFHSPDRTANSKKSFVESEKEKEYERKHNVEVVHKNDGTTYERKAPKKSK